PHSPPRHGAQLLSRYTRGLSRRSRLEGASSSGSTAAPGRHTAPVVGRQPPHPTRASVPGAHLRAPRDGPLALDSPCSLLCSISPCSPRGPRPPVSAATCPISRWSWTVAPGHRGGTGSSPSWPHPGSVGRG